ncbi:HNH endonuclease [Vibrio phage K250 g1]
MLPLCDWTKSMIKESNVLVRPHGPTIKHYRELGYEITGGEILVSVNHLTKSSTVRITAVCGICENERPLLYKDYKENCVDCSRKSKVGENNPAWTGGRNKCSVCGDETTNWKANVCGSCHLKRDQSGDRNAQWKGGKGACACGNPLSDHRGKECRACFLARTKKDETEKRQRNKAHKTLVKNVLIRDDYTCGYCGGKNADKLEVHHLEGWADNKDLRFIPDNCVTLCKGCHAKFHKIYGYGNNTTEQFNEFKDGQK